MHIITVWRDFGANTGDFLYHLEGLAPYDSLV